MSSTYPIAHSNAASDERDVSRPVAFDQSDYSGDAELVEMLRQRLSEAEGTIKDLEEAKARLAQSLSAREEEFVRWAKMANDQQRSLDCQTPRTSASASLPRTRPCPSRALTGESLSS
jgi:hypothetical protein